MTLTDFLLARIAEDEEHVCPCCEVRVYGSSLVNFAQAEREAKRRIVRDYLAHVRYYERREADGLPADAVRRDARIAARAVEVLAAAYADHPDYREEWKP